MCGKWHWVISIIKRKTAVTPLLMHWSYCCHVPIHWEIVCSAAAWPWVLARMSTRIFTGCGLRGVRRWPQATRQCRVRQQRARRTEYHGLICQVEYQLCGSVSNIVMALCKTAVSPLLTHWRYCSHALSLQYSLFFFPEMHDLLYRHKILCDLFLKTLVRPSSHIVKILDFMSVLFQIYPFMTAEILL